MYFINLFYFVFCQGLACCVAVIVSVLDLTPQSEYEVYMKSYGRANTAQVCGRGIVLEGCIS